MQILFALISELANTVPLSPLNAAEKKEDMSDSPALKKPKLEREAWEGSLREKLDLTHLIFWTPSSILLLFILIETQAHIVTVVFTTLLCY